MRPRYDLPLSEFDPERDWRDLYVSYHAQLRYVQRVDGGAYGGRELVNRMQREVRDGVRVDVSWADQYLDQPGRLSRHPDSRFFYYEPTAALYVVSLRGGPCVTTVLRLVDRYNDPESGKTK